MPSTRGRMTVDGNEAAASVAYRASETIAIYPITPSSPMAEHCDEWSSRKNPNLWGLIPELAEMQSLLDQLDEATLCATCSHGRPTAILLSHTQLEREFSRR